MSNFFFINTKKENIFPFLSGLPQGYPHANQTDVSKKYTEGNFSPLYLIVAITCGITCWVWHKPEWEDILIYDCCKVRQYGEWYRLLTSGFLHENMQHLLGNMISLSIGGYILLRTNMKRSSFVFFYISSIVFAGLFAHIFYQPPYLRVVDGGSIMPQWTALGASGGVYAVITTAFVVLFKVDYKSRKFSDFFKIFPKGHLMARYILFFSATLLGCFFGANDGIGHHAHMGGIIWGSLFGFSFYTEKKKKSKPPLLQNTTMSPVRKVK